MAVITITATGHGPELISGIPMLVELETNLPSVIYFTLDGSDPSVSSTVYVEEIQLPTENSVRLRVLAISGPDSRTLDVTFHTAVTVSVPTRRLDDMGIVVDAYGVTPVVIDGYGIDHLVADSEYLVDSPVRRSDIPLVDLETQYSRVGPDGEGPGTLIPIGFPDQTFWEKRASVDPRASSPNHHNVFFNPRSQLITIDGRDGYSDQSVYIINRPWAGTMDDLAYLNGKLYYEPQPYISGGFVRSFFDYDRGIAVFYYFDHNECRWIRSIQRLEGRLPRGVAQRRGSNPLVFKWIYGRRSMV